MSRSATPATACSRLRPPTPARSRAGSRSRRAAGLLLEAALRDAAGRGAETIGTASLLRALLDDGESEAITILDGIAGVDAVRAELAAITGPPGG